MGLDVTTKHTKSYMLWEVHVLCVCVCVKDNLVTCLVVYLLGVGLYALSPCIYQILSNELFS